jgi:hypothetical protein
MSVDYSNCVQSNTAYPDDLGVTCADLLDDYANGKLYMLALSCSALSSVLFPLFALLHMTPCCCVVVHMALLVNKFQGAMYISDVTCNYSTPERLVCLSYCDQYDA